MTREPEYTCLTPWRAVRTTPAAGTPYELGDPVTLVVTEPYPTARCAGALDTLAWQLLDFANGRGRAPEFASGVAVYVNGERSTLTKAEAADPATWGPDSALGLLAAQTRQESTGEPMYPLGLQVHRDDGTKFWCGEHSLPAELANRDSLWFQVTSPEERHLLACTFANVYQTDEQIDAIVVRTAHTLEGDEQK